MYHNSRVVDSKINLFSVIASSRYMTPEVISLPYIPTGYQKQLFKLKNIFAVYIYLMLCSWLENTIQQTVTLKNV